MDPKREKLMAAKKSAEEASPPKIISFIRLVQNQQVEIRAISAPQTIQDTVLLSYR